LQVIMVARFDGCERLAQSLTELGTIRRGEPGSSRVRSQKSWLVQPRWRRK